MSSRPKRGQSEDSSAVPFRLRGNKRPRTIYSPSSSPLEDTPTAIQRISLPSPSVEPASPRRSRRLQRVTSPAADTLCTRNATAQPLGPTTNGSDGKFALGGGDQGDMRGCRHRKEARGLRTGRKKVEVEDQVDAYPSPQAPISRKRSLQTRAEDGAAIRAEWMCAGADIKIEELRAQLKAKDTLIELLKEDKRRLQDLWYAPQKVEDEEVLRQLHKQIDEAEEVEDWTIGYSKRILKNNDRKEVFATRTGTVRPPIRSSSKGKKERESPTLHVEVGKPEVDAIETPKKWGKVDSWRPDTARPRVV